MNLYRFLDFFFIAFHSILILFSLFGWIIKSFRRANLVMLLLIGCSWFILGIFYGIGYCPLTEWHWQVLHKLGQHNLPGSYVSYLVERLSGFLPNAKVTDVLTLVLYFSALGISVRVNLFKNTGLRKKNMRNEKIS